MGVGPVVSGQPPLLVRTPDQRLRVFVSSTLEELARERVAVRSAIESLHLTPVMFELGARPHAPRTLYRAYLDQSHVFVAVYWQRYGWIAPEEDISGLEDEYRLSGDKPRLIYVKEPAPEREARLAELLDRVMEDDRASFKMFTTQEELGELVADDLAILLTERFESGSAAPGDAPRHDGWQDPAPPAPAPVTPLVGRHRELRTILDLVMSPASRLVTLSGPGGIGKSRLALEVVAQLPDVFADGCHVVGLGAVRDPALVAPTIAHALGVRESAGATPFENLKGYVTDKSMLLVLDNFEQVASAATLVADLLASAPGLVVLVTSRTTLRVRGEHDVIVEPLPVPSPDEFGDLRTVSESEAVQLFVERARAVNPACEITEENAADIAEICRRLDGMPLAIELAAARTRVLTPAALLARLTRSLELLTGGARDLPERQRTLRATLDWDHELLDGDEKRLFRRLAVFSGGWSLDAVEAVNPPQDDSPWDVLDALESLIGKSLVRSMDPDGYDLRFGMLGIIREYALERLEESGEGPELRTGHARFFLDLAEAAAREQRGPEQAEWMARLERDHDNLRAALRWSDDELDVDAVVRLSAALAWFWLTHGHFTEGRRWVDRAMALSVGERTATRARLLQSASYLAKARGDRERATHVLNEALGIRREIADHDGVADVLKMLGVVEADRNNLDEAVMYFERSLEARPADGDRRAQAETLNNLGVIARIRGDLDAAVTWLEDAVDVFRETGDREGVARVVMNLGGVNLDRGRLDEAKAQSVEALLAFQELGSTWDMVDALDDLASVAGLEGRPVRAGTLFGATESLREAIGSVRSEPEQEDFDRLVAAARERDPDAFAAAWAAGRTLTLEQTVAFVLADDDAAQRVKKPGGMM